MSNQKKPKASAPRPRPEGAREAEAAARSDARKLIRITLGADGDVYDVPRWNMPLKFKGAVRDQTTRTWEDVIGAYGYSVDIMSVAILVWLARRCAGEPDLRWSEVEATWDPAIEISDVSAEVIDVAEAGDSPPL